MSAIVLPQIDLSAAVVGVITSYDFSTIIQTGITPLQLKNFGNPKLQLYNESPVGLQLELAQSKKQFNLPAGGWAKIEIGADDKGFTWKPLYILLTPAAVNLLLISYLPPGDSGTDVVVLGNSPVNGVVTVTDITAQFLEGSAQTLKVTELDTAGGNPMLIPANGAGIALALGARDAVNVAREIVDVSATVGNEFTVARGDGSGNLGAIHADDISLTGQVVVLNGKFTVGSFGVPAILASASQTGIVSTATQTIASFTPTADGFVRGNLWFRVNNGGAATITALLTYNDGVINGARTNPFTATGAAGTAVANAAVIGNGFVSCMPLVAWIKAGTAVTITYRDSTNTPNDSAFAVIEQLA